MPRGARLQPERSEQAALVAWFRLRFPNELLFAIPNGGSRHFLEAANLKRSGLVAGVPDLMLAAPRMPWHGAFIEMKRADKPARMSASQIKMAQLLQDKGYLTLCAKGWVEAKIHIEDYLKGAPWMA